MRITKVRIALGAAVCLCLLAMVWTFTVWDGTSPTMLQPNVLKNTDSNENTFLQAHAPVNERTTKKMHISYLKTPKTGSSTLACIFYRFAFRNNLSMYLPIKNTINSSDQNLVLSKGKQFDVFNIHTHYNHTFFTTVVKDPAIIGQVRRPLNQMISSAFYSVKQRYKNMTDQDFINHVIKSGKAGSNMQALFLGIPRDIYKNKEALQKTLQKINTEFTLMLVLERMEESVVLMKRLLNWTISDIVYDIKNVSTYHISLSKAQNDTILRRLAVDVQVYDFFVNVLEKKIESAGNDFQGEVNYFRYVQSKVSDFCKGNSSGSERLVIPSSRWEKTFAFKRINCDLIYNHGATSLKNMGRAMLLEKNELDD